MLRYANTLAFLSVAAAWSTDIESSVQHPDAHIDGFVISAVHLHGDDGSLHRRRLRFDEHPPRARRLEAAPFSATKNSRARVLTLMKLNVAAYPSYLDTGDGAFDRTWSEDVMSAILAEHNQALDAPQPLPYTLVEESLVPPAPTHFPNPNLTLTLTPILPSPNRRILTLTNPNPN